MDTYVVVIGGANMDLKARAAATLVPGTSNPGTTRRTPGGVGRNIAENLARLGTPVHLITAVGADPLGDELLGATAAAGAGIDHVRRVDLPTGIYAATLQPTGELAVAVADMAATSTLGPEVVEATRDLIAVAALLVLDANLGADTLAAALERAHTEGVPVVVDPVSVPKATLLSGVLADARPVHTLTPNVAELGALTERADLSGPDEIDDAARSLLLRGVDRVWVRLGERGSVLVEAGLPTVSVSAAPVEVVDVSGAGDAMLAAYCHALLRGQPAAEAAAFGQAAAALTVGVPETVRPDLTAALVAATLERTR